MNTVQSILAMCALAAPCALVAQGDPAPAEEHSQHEQHAAPAGPAAGAQPAGVHEHMREMQEQMARIHSTQDAGERERLMHEHMQSMQQHMQMMGSMSAERRPMSASRCADGDAACRMDELRAENGMARERMRGLEDRLVSIEGLLQQMLEHQRAAETQSAASRRERDRRR